MILLLAKEVELNQIVTSFKENKTIPRDAKDILGKIV